MLLNALNVNGFTGGAVDDFLQNEITGTVNISDAVSNSNSIYFRRNTINGNTTITNNSAVGLYESYQGSNTYNGNVTLIRNNGTILFSYDNPSNINQGLTLNSDAGISFGDTLRFGGSSNDTLEQLGTQPISIPNLKMQKTGSGSLTLNDSVTVTTKATLTGGNIITGSNKLIIPTTASIQNLSATEWFVNGNLQMNFPTGNNTKNYRIGDTSGYRPVSLTLNGVTGAGGVTISTASGDHPDIGTSTISPNKSVNRNWIFTKNGLNFTTASTTLNWDASEVDVAANTANLLVGKYNTPNWTYPAIVNPTATSIQAQGITTFSDFIVGENASPTFEYRTITSGAWESPATWETFDGFNWVPSNVAPSYLDSTITIRNGHTISINASITVDQLIIEANATVTEF